MGICVDFGGDSVFLIEGVNPRAVTTSGGGQGKHHVFRLGFGERRGDLVGGRIDLFVFQPRCELFARPRHRPVLAVGGDFDDVVQQVAGAVVPGGGVVALGVLDLVDGVGAAQVGDQVAVSQAAVGDGGPEGAVVAVKGVADRLVEGGLGGIGGAALAGDAGDLLGDGGLCLAAVGAGAVTKLKAPFSGEIERIFNYKYPYEYINDFEKILNRKNYIEEFYGKYIHEVN